MEVLIMCAENSMVQGMVRNHPQIGQRGACGSKSTRTGQRADRRERQQVQQDERRFGIASTRSGRPTSSA